MKQSRYVAAIMIGTFALLIVGGCARRAGEPIYSATASAQYDALNREETGLTRRQALQVALRTARDEILRIAANETRLSNGQTLGELAVIDPYVRSVLEDTVRAARIADQTFSDEGVVTVTVEMELDPIYRLIDDYPQHAIR